MRLAWTAIVPRSLVEGLDNTTLEQAGQRVLAVTPHDNPALRVVRCYLRRPAAQAEPAPLADADHLPAA